MIDPALTTILLSTFTYGWCGSLVAAAVRFMNRDKPGPQLHQVAAVGFLIGAAFGAFFGVFESMIERL